MEQEPNDIIRQLADQLKAHELPYQQGAWEKFLEHQAAAEKKQDVVEPVPAAKPAGGKVVPLGAAKRRWSIQKRSWAIGVAAVVLIAIGAGWLYFGQQAVAPAGTTPDNQQVAMNNRSAIKNNGAKDQDQNSIQAATSGMPHTDGSLAGAAAGTKAPGNEQAAPHDAVDLAAARSIAADAIAGIPLNVVHNNVNMQQSTWPLRSRPGLQINPVGPVFTLEPPDAGPANWDAAQAVAGADAKGQKENASKAVAGADMHPVDQFSDHFDDRGYFEVGGPDKDRMKGKDRNNAGRSTASAFNSRKWQMGVMVVPGLSNNAKLNMGYGVSVGYQLNNRLSLNSGLAYAALSGAKDASELQNASSASQGITTLASSGRALSAIEASITGLKVPLELRYQVNSKIYIGTGVSAMAVLSDKVERRYTIAQMQSSALAASSGGMLKADGLQSLAANVKTTEVIPDEEVGAKNVAGFINFSLGLRQPVNKNKSISIEPFVSVPMNTHLFNQNIKMTDAGIRIKLGL